MGRRAEGRRTHGTPRHGGNEPTPERSRARDRHQGLEERAGRFVVAHRRSAVGARHARARARPARRPSERKDQRAVRVARVARAARPRAVADENRRPRRREQKALPATGDIRVAPPTRRCAGQEPERPPHRGRRSTEASQCIVECFEGCDGTAPAPDQASPVDNARDLGAALFRAGKYAAVREVFLTLIQSDPNDARLWYFAALSNGLTSGDWAGDSEGLVRRGLACEQGGKPKRRTSTPSSRR